jgi:hypothetical protein
MDHSIANRYDWRLLPLIIVGGLFIGWVSGQLVSLIPQQDVAVAERPRPTPR